MLKKYTFKILIIALFVTQNLNASQVAVVQRPANIELEAKHWKEHYERRLLKAAGDGKDGSLVSLEYFIKRGDININVQDEDGNTPLMVAIENGFSVAASKLIDAGADFTLKNNKEETAFLVAIISGQFSLAERLMSLGADVNSINKLGQTAFILMFWRSGVAVPENFIIKLLARANNFYHKSNYGIDVSSYSIFERPCLRQALDDYEKRRLAYAKQFVAPIIIENIQELYPVLAEIVADYYTGGGLPAEEKKEEEKRPSQEK